MTVRSIDMQVLIPRATEVSRVQQITDQQTSLQQQQFAQQLQAVVAHRRQYAQPLAKTDHAAVHDQGARQEGREQREAERHQPSMHADDVDDGGTEPSKGHIIDIRT